MLESEQRIQGLWLIRNRRSSETNLEFGITNICLQLLTLEYSTPQKPCSKY